VKKDIDLRRQSLYSPVVIFGWGVFVMGVVYIISYYVPSLRITSIATEMLTTVGFIYVTAGGTLVILGMLFETVTEHIRLTARLTTGYASFIDRIVTIVENQNDEIESIVTVVEHLSSKTEPVGRAGVPAVPDVKKRTRAATEKITELKGELKATFEAKIAESEKRLRSEWRFVVVFIVSIVLTFAALLFNLRR